ncbi:MAG: ferredoxin [Sedimenticola sp.]
MSFYRYHLFFCINQREGDEACCQQFNARDAHFYVKTRLKSLGLDGAGQVRANKAGCLGRCEQGPVLVVYPDAVWYTYVDRADLDEIVEEHLLNGRVVERLLLRD